MGIFSALLGNAGTVDQESLLKEYGKLPLLMVDTYIQVVYPVSHT